MKERKIIYLLMLTIISSIFFVACHSKEDDLNQKTSIPLFDQSVIETIQGVNETTWRISEVISSYDNDDGFLLSTECLSDDKYTFKPGTEDIEVTLGNKMCYGEISDSESFEAKIIFNENEQTVQLLFKDCMIQKDGQYDYKTCFISEYYLAELTEDRMVFYSDNTEFIGEYTEALIFERI